MKNYRNRIYGHYSSARSVALAPSSVAGLASRGFFIRKIIREHFPSSKEATILDIGCGYGAILHFAAEAGYNNAYGIDGSSEQVDAAHKLGIANARKGDIESHLLDILPSSIDCIIAFDVFEHFDRDELVILVDLVRRVLKVGGRLIIHTPNGDSPFVGRMLFGDLTHETLFTSTSIEQLLKSSGYQNIYCHEDRPIPHGIKSTIRLLLWHCIRLVLRFYLAVETGSGGRNLIFSQNFLVTAVKA